eukprot:5962218-Amphidinium_carterae.1
MSCSQSGARRNSNVPKPLTITTIWVSCFMSAACTTGADVSTAWACQLETGWHHGKRRYCLKSGQFIVSACAFKASLVHIPRFILQERNVNFMGRLKLIMAGTRADG